MTELTITQLGRKGDGIAHENGRDIFVPFTLAREKVTVTGNGARRELISVVDKSADRIEAICKHFRTCGGCQLQHMEDNAYKNWKEALALEPLKKSELDFDAQPIISYATAARRKVVFNLVRKTDGIALGFAERASDQIISLDECAVMVPELIGQLPQLKELAASVPISKSGTRMSVLATLNGLDISIDGAAKISEEQRQVLIRKTIASKFARLTFHNETLIETKKPILLMDNIQLTPPPGSFVQAVKQAEETMIEITTDHLMSCKNVADLYCGIGTFALPLARQSTVWAVEENKPALEALDHAWRNMAGKLKHVKSELRNLERRPVTFSELKKFDGLVFDPPRAGAEAQAKQIAKSKVEKVVAVSCNPVTLARDLEILINGGFKISKVIPIDQFKFTPHVEMVVTLMR